MVEIVQDIDLPLVMKEPLLFCMMIDLQAQRGLYVSKTFLWLWDDILSEGQFLMSSSTIFFFQFLQRLYEVEIACTISSLIEIKEIKLV